MMENVQLLEERRQKLQSELDAAKTSLERNKLGQFSTPPALADEILDYAAQIFPKGQAVSFLDPAVGTGAFYSALLRKFSRTNIESALGFEVDAHYGAPAAALWGDTSLRIKHSDFTKQSPDSKFNLIICNPPYVRHHHIASDDKAFLKLASLEAAGGVLSGFAGLYCHFLLLSHSWMSDGCIAGWLIPSEFMDVNYGSAVKRYLLTQTTLLHIHRFDPNDVQFSDSLVSSAVVWLKNAPPPKDYEVLFTFGGSLLAPKQSRRVPSAELAQEQKWTRYPKSGVRAQSNAPVLSDFFSVKRGLATGDNSYFILSEDELIARRFPKSAFRPILPSPRYISTDIIEAEADGTPSLERRLFLLDLQMSEPDVKDSYPELWKYLQEGRERGLHERYLCRHRALWYAQEKREPAPIVCTYMGRGDLTVRRPFRFILNRSNATVANVYLALYPTTQMKAAIQRHPGILEEVWRLLNAIPSERLLGEGRVYGGGLHKLEPKELLKMPVPEFVDLLAKWPELSLRKEVPLVMTAAE